MDVPPSFAEAGSRPRLVAKAPISSQICRLIFRKHPVQREREKKTPARAALTCRSLGDRARTLAIHNKTRHRTCESGGATLTSWYPRRAGRRTGQIVAQRIASASAITGHAPAFRSPALNARSPTSFFSAATSSFALTSAGVLSGIATMFYGAKDQRRRKQGMLIDAEG